MLHVEMIPILKDNFVFAIVNTHTNETVIVDPGASAPVLDFLKQKKLTLKAVLITHHHYDHIDGLKDILAQTQVPIYAPLKNKAQIPLGTHWVSDNEEISLESFHFKVLELPGHTLGHVGYWMGQEKWLFSGDVLFGLGCGRLFEGTPEQMFNSLEKIKSLPNETLIWCTHEYTLANLSFCESILEDFYIQDSIRSQNLKNYAHAVRELRENHHFTVPLNLKIQKEVNPFLIATSISEFAKIRELRNNF